MRQIRWPILALALILALAVSCPAWAETIADPRDPASIYTSANPIPDIAQRVRPAVVQVISLLEEWDPYTRAVWETEIGYGSGVYIDEGGYIVTNNHVVASAARVADPLAGWRRDGRGNCGNRFQHGSGGAAF